MQKNTIIYILGITILILGVLLIINNRSVQTIDIIDNAHQVDQSELRVDPLVIDDIKSEDQVKGSLKEQSPDTNEKDNLLIKEDIDSRFVGEGCKIYSDCNGPIGCIDVETDVSSWNFNCEYRSRYACFREDFNRCEKQAGTEKCGWTQNKELLQCIDDADAQEI